MRLIFYVIYCSFLSFVSYSQIDFTNARSSALGNVKIAIDDAWTIENCSAFLTFIDEPNLAVNYSNTYFSKELNSIRIAGVIPIRKYAFGGSYSNLSFSAYSYNCLNVGFAYRLTNEFSIGLNSKIINQNYRDLNLKSPLNYSTDFSFIYKISAQTIIGSSIRNLEGFFSDKFSYSPLFEFGGRSGLSSDFKLFYQMKAGFNESFSLHVGGEYSIKSLFYIRAGFASDYNRIAFGLGLKKNKMNLDFTSSYHVYLGWTPSFSLAYAFK